MMNLRNRRNLFSQERGNGLLAFGAPAAPQMPFRFPTDTGRIPMGPPGRRYFDLKADAFPEQETEQTPTQASPREVFDYEGARKQLEANNKSASWADRFARAAAFMNDDWGKAAEITGRMAVRARDTDNTIEKWKREDWVDQRQADLQAMHPTTIGRARVVYNPVTRESQEVYRGPEDFDLYAKHLGLEPGTDEYFRAVEDYVLKSSGPSAHGRDIELDDHRTDNDVRLVGVRQGHRTSLEGIRQGNREKLRKMPLPPRATLAGAPRKGGSVPTAIDPRTGRKVELRNGQWVPVK